MADDLATADEAESGKETLFGTGTKPTTRQSLSRFVMIFLFMLGLWAIVDQQLSYTFGYLAGVVLYPVIGFGGTAPVATILLAGLLTTTISSILRHHYTDWVKMMRFNRTQAALRKAQMEAMRKGNPTHISKFKKIQNDLMREHMDVQFAPMKSMAWTFFLFIVIFTWIRVFVDQTLSILGNQYFAVPWGPHVWFEAAYVLPTWVLLYSLLAIPFSQIATRVLKYIRFRRVLIERGLPLKAEPDTTG